MSPRIHRFDGLDAACDTLAKEVSARLAAAINERGVATLAVSGGSTPKPLFERLADAPLDWSRVRVTLVDERCVDPDDSASNNRLVRSSLLQGRAVAAAFFPLYRDDLIDEPLADTLELMLETQFPLYDAVLMGMGEDGHTASIFPGSPIADSALDADGSEAVLITEEAQAGYRRITQTYSRLTRSRFMAFLVAGDAKIALLEQIVHEGASSTYPVARFLCQQRVPVEIFTATTLGT